MLQPKVWTLRRKIVGVSLRQSRLDAGKTLKECGRAVGLSSSMLSAIERGKRGISLPELEMLAYYLQVPLDQLLNGDTQPTRTPIEELPGSEMLALRHRIIGALLRQARLDIDLTQNELAKRVGIPKGRLSRYELGERPIPLVELQAMAESLRISWDHFLDKGIGTIGEQQQLEREWQQFTKLSPDLRAFVLNPTNQSYLQLAISLSDVSADGLRNIAASLLDITL